MGGGGFALHAIKTMKQNRAMLKKRKSIKENGINSYSNIEEKPVFKTVSKEELKRLKREIRKEGDAVKRRDFIITVVVITIFTGLFFLWVL
ncbi:hypothetical protein [uncultured Maribacter sp.]|uniref:hypothetical protein n=1 Tax=uncultured Maribacter sp. TaxID=431308 RepID=UPI00262BDDB8|nr:hypothetical protein [uncultured Maribacter sp.]